MENNRKQLYTLENNQNYDAWSNAPRKSPNTPKKSEKGPGHITVPYTKTPKYLQKTLPNTPNQLYTLENIENYEAWSNTAQNTHYPGQNKQ